MFTTKPSTKEVIEQIHKEFNTAGDLLLAQANEILNDHTNAEILNKGLKLQHLGFVSAQTTKESAELQVVREKNAGVAKAVREFKMLYPNNKFISAEDVQRICKKYNLFQGPVEAFKAHVPDKNMEEIAQFSSKNNIFGYKFKSVQFRYESDRRDHGKEVAKFLQHYIFSNQSEYDAREVIGQNTSCSTTVPRDAYGVSKLTICAPEKDFTTKGLNRNWLTRTIESATKITVSVAPDPVVLYPVAYQGVSGYIIVTAWGDEANDPLIFNEQKN